METFSKNTLRVTTKKLPMFFYSVSMQLIEKNVVTYTIEALDIFYINSGDNPVTRCQSAITPNRIVSQGVPTSEEVKILKEYL